MLQQLCHQSHKDTMQRSEDGTVKNAVRLHDGLVVESVLINKYQDYRLYRVK
jgi:hypothetical protein